MLHMRKDEAVLYFGVNPWDSLLQRPQHLARGLSRRRRVLYVDPTAFSVLTKLASALKKEGGRRGWLPRLRRLSDSLHVFTPPPLFPFSLWSGTATFLNARLAAGMLTAVLTRLDFHPRILWISSPQHHLLPDLMPADLVCYDCLDNFAAFYPDRRGKLLAAQENAMLDKAQVVFATDGSLEARCRGRCTQVHLLPNAVDTGFLKSPALPCPRELSSLPGPVIGYVGTISHWVDLGLIRALAASRPGWSFVLVGPADNRAIPSGLPNLHFLGEKRHEELPAYLDRMDVCLIPFVPGELTHSVNPVKLYEYLARGKPVVATETRALRPFAGLCSLATGPGGFLAAIESALSQTGRAKTRVRRQRIAFAAENTWDHRVREVEKILELFTRCTRKV